jgi:hypothetical protein
LKNTDPLPPARYVVLSWECRTLLVHQVNALLNQGWQLHGGLCVTPFGDWHTIFSQALVDCRHDMFDRVSLDELEQRWCHDVPGLFATLAAAMKLDASVLRGRIEAGKVTKADAIKALAAYCDRIQAGTRGYMA